jgi:hypothetical protein
VQCRRLQAQRQQPTSLQRPQPSFCRLQHATRP